MNFRVMDKNYRKVYFPGSHEREQKYHCKTDNDLLLDKFLDNPNIIFLIMG